MNNFIVIGQPIEHSLSPKIHAAFSKQCGIPLTYEKKLSSHADFERDLKWFFAQEGKGANVTVPFKTRAFEFATDHTERALFAGACNTLMRRENGEILGDNTDGAGLITDLTKRVRLSLPGTKILILGAGGAVRGILGPIIDSKCEHVCIATRDPVKAQSLKDQFPSIQLTHYDAIPEINFDLIINATSAGLAEELPPLPTRCMTSSTIIYDCTYGPKAKPFLDWCRAEGASELFDGIGMLVEQAAESFLLWHGVRPQTAEIIRELEKESSCTTTYRNSKL